MHTLLSETMNGAEDHRRGSTMMSTRSLPVDTLGRLKHWWPSQAYHCTFCTRVFRTAQALGGHMNIHRRERACVSSPGIPPASRQLVPQLLTPPPRAGHELQPSQQLQVATGFLTKVQPGATPRPGSCNGGYGKLDLVVEPARVPPGSSSTTISDPLTWLFSQLPPPRLPPPPVSKPFHRGLAVCKSPPGVRRHVCRIHTSPLAAQSHVLYTGMMQSRTRGLVGVEYSSPELRISHGVDHHPAPDQQTCALDLELRL